MKAPPSARGADRHTALLAAIGALGAALVLLRVDVWGAGLTADSTAYVSVARNLLDGGGFTLWNGDAFADHAPFFPMALAFLGLFGADAPEGAGYLNAASFGLTSFAAGAWVRSRTASPALAAWAAAACALSPALAGFASHALADALFALLVCLSLFALDRHLGGGVPDPRGAAAGRVDAPQRRPHRRAGRPRVAHRLLAGRQPPRRRRRAPRLDARAARPGRAGLRPRVGRRRRGRTVGGQRGGAGCCPDRPRGRRGGGARAAAARRRARAPAGRDGAARLRGGLRAGAGRRPAAHGHRAAAEVPRAAVRAAAGRGGADPARRPAPPRGAASRGPRRPAGRARRGGGAGRADPVGVPRPLARAVGRARRRRRARMARARRRVRLARVGRLRHRARAARAPPGRPDLEQRGARAVPAGGRPRGQPRAAAVPAGRRGSVGVVGARLPRRAGRLDRVVPLAPLAGARLRRRRARRAGGAAGGDRARGRRRLPRRLGRRRRGLAARRRRALRAAVRGARLAARSHWDVYLDRERAVYVREDCAEADTRPRFFLHVTPADPSDLPRGRRGAGFANLNFGFADHGFAQDGRCVAVRNLPPWPAAAVSTGQWLPGRPPLWRADIGPPPR